MLTARSQRLLVAPVRRRFLSTVEPVTTTIPSTVTFGPFGAGGEVDGFVQPGWERVRDAFEANFATNL